MIDTGDNLVPLICLLSRLSSLHMKRQMERIGIGEGQCYLLAALYAEEGLSQEALSQRVGADKAATSRALDKLARYGLVRKDKDPHNHRIKRIYLEPKARSLQARFRRIQADWETALAGGLTPAQRARTLARLKTMVDNARSAVDPDRSHPSG